MSEIFWRTKSLIFWKWELQSLKNKTKGSPYTESITLLEIGCFYFKAYEKDLIRK